MRQMLILCLVLPQAALATGVWSIDQSPLAPEYILCRVGETCPAHSQKIVDMGPARPAAVAVPVAAPQRPRVIAIEPVAVLFPLASSRLDESARGVLDGMKGWREGPYRIRIVGMTDRLGSRAFNQKLARARAQAVADHLIRHGYDAKRIAVDSQCCVDFPPTANPAARRALIHVSSTNEITETP